jgi:hypothetical protein
MEQCAHSTAVHGGASMHVTVHILDVTLQEHRPFGEPMTGSLGKNRNKARQTKTLGL